MWGEPVLVADDESAFVGSVVRGLREIGKTAVTVDSGAALTNILANTNVDAAVLEPHLPGVSWWTVLDELNERGLCPKLVIASDLPGEFRTS